ncbi:MAG: PTS transporter subunit EIIB [Bacilli bacterium]|nr:PTS transporter subunit EIIB [Bacilli bacterium]
MILNELKNDFNVFLKNNALWICLGIVLLIVITIIIFIVISIRFKNKNKLSNYKVDHSLWLEALGDKENIVSIEATMSRLTIIVNDQEKVDKEKLKTLGVSNIITMSNKIILVVENKAQEIKSELER